MSLLLCVYYYYDNIISYSFNKTTTNEIIEFSLDAFTEFSEFCDEIVAIIEKGLKLDTSYLRDNSVNSADS